VGEPLFHLGVRFRIAARASDLLAASALRSGLLAGVSITLGSLVVLLLATDG
jgi:hypothetical protein